MKGPNGPGPVAIDVFAGAGGLSCGLEAAGFEVGAAVEMEPVPCSTFRAGHPAAEVFQQDISTMDFRCWRGSFDLLAGGPPCQPFSVGGKRLAADDPRDGVPYFVRAVAGLRPRAFVMENVAGLVAGAKKAYFDDLLAQLGKLGYSLSWRVLQAADYGVPQLRRRLFLVGSRTRRFRFPPPAFGTAAGVPHRSAGRVVDPRHPRGTPNQAIVTYALNPTLRPSPYHGHLYNGGGRPIDLARPSPTLLASMGGNKTPWVDTLGTVPGYHADLMAGRPARRGVVPGARRITVEEAAALQTFPAGTAFSGPLSSRYRQVGNAVPPLLAERVGRALMEQLFG